MMMHLWQYVSIALAFVCECTADCPPNTQYCPTPDGVCLACCANTCVPGTVVRSQVPSAAARAVTVTSTVPGLRSKCGVVASADIAAGFGSGFTAGMLRTGDVNALAWQTNWKPFGLQQGFTPADYGSVKLVPQFWGLGETGDNFPQVQPPMLPVMLGYDEPDENTMEGGSGISPPAALDGWMRLVEKAKLKGYSEFVAPSIAKALHQRYTGAPEIPCDNCEWLVQFLELCLERPGCPATVTYLGFHLYEPNCMSSYSEVKRWNYDVRVGSMKKLMAELNSRGMDIKGLWLTEFAGISGTEACRTWQQQKKWIEIFVPMLNADPDVVAYSWFSYDKQHSSHFLDDASLFDYNTGQLSPLGEAYFTACQTLPPLLGPMGKVCVFLALLVAAFALVWRWRENQLKDLDEVGQASWAKRAGIRANWTFISSSRTPLLGSEID